MCHLYLREKGMLVSQSPGKGQGQSVPGIPYLISPQRPDEHHSDLFDFASFFCPLDLGIGVLFLC